MKRINHEAGIQIQHHATFVWVFGIKPLWIYFGLPMSYTKKLNFYIGRDWWLFTNYYSKRTCGMLGFFFRIL